MFEQSHQNATEASGEHTAFAPALGTHLLALPAVRCCLLGLGCCLRTAPNPQQPQGRNCDGQPQSLGPLRVFHPRMLPLPTTPFAVLDPLLDPTAQAVPGSIALSRGQVTQDQPR